MGEQGGVEEGEFGGLGGGWGVAGGGRVSACMTEGRRRRRLNEGFDPSVIAAPRRKENTHAHTQLTTQHNTTHTHTRARRTASGFLAAAGTSKISERHAHAGTSMNHPD